MTTTTDPAYTAAFAAAHTAFDGDLGGEPRAALNAALTAFANDLATRGLLHTGQPSPPQFPDAETAAQWVVNAADNLRVTALGFTALLHGPGSYEYAVDAIRARGTELGPDTPYLLRAAVTLLREVTP